MKDINLLASALLSISLIGCGTVVGPDGAEPTELEVAYPDEPAIDGRPPALPAPLLLEAPRAATTTRSLFGMTFAANAQISDVLRTSEVAHVDVVEQRIVTTTDDEVELLIELAPPTGTFSRVIVSDVVRLGIQTNDVLCESNNIATFDPRCDQTAPATRVLPGDGAITAAQWKLWVLDESTSAPVGSCEPAGADRVACVLPGRAVAGYRIMASANGFADLWDGSPGLGQQIQGGVPFTGAFAVQRDYLCWDWVVTANAFYCSAHYEYLRFNAVDRAMLELDPVTLRVTVNGRTTEMASPALAWDAGDDDVPGAN